MNLTPSDLARRLKEAREAAGLRQEDVARHLGLSRSSVAQIELGNRAVTGLELGQLGRLYGRDVRDFLATEFDPGETVLALFRAAPEVAGQDEALAAILDCLQLSRELASLESLLGLDRSQIGAPAYSFDPPRSRGQAVEQGNRVASDERRRLGLGNRSLGDAAELVEEQGVRTAMLDLPEEVSGLTLMERGSSLAIVTNRRHHRLRRQFSWVHEYAHVLLDRAQRGTISLESRRDDLAEVRANAFAASFLMPEEGVRAFLADLGCRERSDPIGLYEVVLLAHHFQVSRTMAIYRLSNLRLLPQAAREALLNEEKSGRGKRIEDLLGLPHPDHAAARDEFRLRFLGLAIEAYRREKITRAKLRELALLVGYDRAAIDDLLESAGLDGEDVEPLLPEDLE
ncbi:MAG TPA: XRE family transcriptional regulator [Thermoanaerobaculia bacterium]|nr:XRE family transcriptional regulator [Thermoanaerobaculia bacterium]